MMQLQVADEGDSLKAWRIAMKILSKTSWIGNNGWSSNLRVEQGLKFHTKVSP
jgi:hypothetical protein